MKKQKIRSKQTGISLIEALVAFAILAFGIAGTLRLNTVLIRETSETRDRLQALGIANRTISDLRSANTQAQYDALLTSTTTQIFPITGDNRNQYSRAVTTNGNTATVTVTWPSRFEQGSTREVRLTTKVAFINPAIVASSDTAGNLNTFTQKVRPPTGNATTRPSTGQISDLSEDEAGKVKQLTDLTNLYNLQVKKIDQTYVLIDKTGRRLLQSTNSDSFSSISGRIYIDKRDYTTTPPLARDIFFILVSDASYCAVTPEIPSSSGPSYNSTTFNYDYLDYTCFVGSNWYGRIGIIRIDNPNVQERVCIGDPRVSQILPFNREYPALHAVREYRGFDTKTFESTKFYETFGIGYRDSSDTNYTPMHHFGHHFYLTKLSGGNPTSSDCDAAMKRSAATTVTPHPFDPYRPSSTTIASRSYPIEAPKNADDKYNPGKYFCFPYNYYDGKDGIPTCPFLFPKDGPTNLQLIIDNNTKDLPAITSMKLNGLECTSKTAGQIKEFTCTYNLVDGFAGTTWTNLPLTASINLSAGVQNICISNTSGLILQSNRFSGPTLTGEIATWQLDLSGTITNLSPKMTVSAVNSATCP